MFIRNLEQLFKQIFMMIGYEIENVNIIKSNRPELCDYQCDDVFKVAKLYHKNPMEIGNAFVEEIKKHSDYNNYFDKIEFAQPGFINITLSDAYINAIINKMAVTEDFDVEKASKPETFFLDYGGPNVAKPLHVGHMRSALVGEAIKRIIAFKGHKTISDVHLGDYGLPIGEVIYGLKKDGLGIDDITLEYMDAAYPRISALCNENEEVLKECAEITKELQEGNPEYQKLWKVINKISSDDIKRIYRYLDVNFDIWYGESDAYPYIPATTKIFNDKGLLKTSEGAKVIEVALPTDTKEMPPLIYQKSNGAYLYGTTDLAAIKQRMDDYHPDHFIYIADIRQAMHFEQVFRASRLGGFVTNETMEFCGFGTINGTDGKPFKTRQGDAPKLDSLFNQIKEIFMATKESNKDMTDEDLNKIVNAIIKFADLQNNRTKNYIFDLAKFSSINGKTGPYILYTALRVDKLTKDCRIDKLNNIIYNKWDRDLRMALLDLNNAVDKAFINRLPSYIADYIYELCVVLNTFYQNNHILTLDDEENKQQWMYLLKISNQILKKMLSLLMIEVPSVM